MNIGRWNKWWIVILVVGIFSTTGFAQKESAEVKFMECAYQVYDNDGAEFHQLMSDFETLLIEEGILVDGSGESFLNIFQTMSVTNEYGKAPSQSFIDSFMQLDVTNAQVGDACIKALMVDSSAYDLSKMEGLEKAINNSENSANMYPGIMAQEVLSILSAEDFELDYYKMRTFMLFEVMIPNLGIASMSSDVQDTATAQDLNSPMFVSLDAENQIFINREKVDIDQLKLHVREYEQENKEASLIVMSSKGETHYDSYLTVQNAIVDEIQVLRKELAEQKYNATLESLTKEQLAEIIAVYPLNISE